MGLQITNFGALSFANGASLTGNAPVPNGDAENAVALGLQLVLTGFTGTVDIQGSMDGTTWVNVPYVTIALGVLTPAVAQLSYTTSTTNPLYVALLTMPFMRLVMTRSAGSIAAKYTGYASPPFLALAGS